MSTDAKSAVEAALESAINGEADSVTAVETEKPVTEKSVAAEKAPAAKETVNQNQSTEGKQKSNSVPYERFHEKVEQVQDLTAKLQSVQDRLAAAVEREDTLNSRLRDLETEADVLDRIRALAEDEQWKPTLERLDAKLRGIEEQVESGEKTEAQGEKDTAKVIQEAKQEIQEAFEDQQTDFIVMEARRVANRYITNLPEEYAAKERALIQDMLTSRVDWDAIAEDPTRLTEIMAQGLEVALTDYGEPRGALQAKLSKFEEQDEATPRRTPAEVARELEETDWSEMVADDTDSNKRKFKHSDEDFAAALAKRLKLGDI